MTWQPIETAPWDQWVQCCHDTRRWLRFGHRFRSQGDRWYYSGTNERSQWAQIEGDAPTHWQPMPELPPYPEGDPK